MGGGTRGTAAATVAAVLVLVTSGCGDGSSPAASEPEASRAFLTPNGTNTIPKFGGEADAEEREAASEALEENLVAREAGDWKTQCASLSPAGVKEVQEGALAQGLEGGGCAKELEARAQPLQQTAALRANSMTGPIDALRVKGNQGYALYHGTKGQDYAMPMEKVDGEWKVSALLEEEL